MPNKFAKTNNLTGKSFKSEYAKLNNQSVLHSSRLQYAIVFVDAKQFCEQPALKLFELELNF